MALALAKICGMKTLSGRGNVFPKDKGWEEEEHNRLHLVLFSSKIC